MPAALRAIFAAILALTFSSYAAAETRGVPVADPDKLCEEIMAAVTGNEAGKAGTMITKSLGSPTSLDFIPPEYRDGPFARKIIDQDHDRSKRHIVYYSYVEKVKFVYFHSISGKIPMAG